MNNEQAKLDESSVGFSAPPSEGLFRDDIEVDLFEAEGNVIKQMIKHGICCESLAFIPVMGVWRIWGAQWSGDLPKGFHRRALKRDALFYAVGMFTVRIEVEKEDKIQE